MTDFPDMTPITTIPESYSLREASDILDRAKLLIAPTLPGCRLRRFDYPIFDGWSHIELCFADGGPILPKLLLSPDGYLCVAVAMFGYTSMLRDKMNVGYEFHGPRFGGMERLDKGPEAIVEMLQKRFADFDLAAAIAKATPEHIWTDRRETHVPTDLLQYSLCGIYLQKYQEAQDVLQDCVRFAVKYDQAGFAEAGEQGKAYLAKLTADPDALRAELIATMNANWSHFKRVDKAT